MYFGSKIRNENSAKALFVAFSLGFSTYAYPETQHGVMLEDVLNKDFVFDSLLETALDPTQHEFEPDEYVTQEPKADIILAPKSGAFKPLEELSSEKDKTFGALIQDAEQERNDYLAAHAPAGDLMALDSGSLQPASPLAALLGTNPVIANPQDLPLNPAAQSVNVVIEKNTVKVSLKEIRIAVGDKLPFSIDEKDKATSELGFFVRDGSMVSWNQTSKVLYAQKEGTTELYLHYDNQLLILPIHVGTADKQLQIPKELTVLNNLGQPRKLLASLDENLTRETRTEAASVKDERATPKKKNTVQHSSTARNASFGFALDSRVLETTKVEFQVVDERSGEKLYPIAGVDLHLIGSEFSKKTDSLGKISEIEVPKNSSFIVTVTDPYQRYRPSTVEIPASKIASGKVTISLIQQATFNAYLRISANEYRSDAGSICATVQTANGKPLSGVTLTMDWEKARPYYFNRLGYLDPQSDRTNENGRFCVFDLDPGPFAFYFKRADGYKEAPIPLTLFTGSHLEHTFTLGEETELHTVLATAPTAFEMWHGGQIMEQEFRAIDYASFVSFGSTQDWNVDTDTVSMHSELSVNDGRAYYLSHSSEFEETLYRLDVDEDTPSDDPVTPLFPNGFLEDISYYANILRSENRGTVFIDHGSFEGQSELSQTVQVSLLDQDSKPVGEKVSMNTVSSSSTLFFNVSPGTYTVVVKSADGVGLSYDTLIVYSGTLSYLHTGSPLYRTSTGSAPPQVTQN